MIVVKQAKDASLTGEQIEWDAALTEIGLTEVQMRQYVKDSYVAEVPVTRQKTGLTLGQALAMAN